MSIVTKVELDMYFIEVELFIKFEAYMLKRFEKLRKAENLNQECQSRHIIRHHKI